MSTRAGVRGNVSPPPRAARIVRTFGFMGVRMSQLESFRVLLVDDDVRPLETRKAVSGPVFAVQGESQ